MTSEKELEDINVFVGKPKDVGMVVVIRSRREIVACSVEDKAGAKSAYRQILKMFKDIL